MGDTVEAPSRRLIITEMVLENFKSYAGEQRVGPFHKSFSSVVGPNGSGKSNVIDAMLFVFGKRAKALRLNKVSELIHNSAGRQGIEQAQVSVRFQEIIDLEGDTYEPIPGTEFVVSRTAHRSNKSDYFVNGKKSSFTEVTALLKSKGIDLDNNRFLILQGEVEQISMMKPKAATEHETGLLEYLEDIIGTNKYIEPLTERAKRVEELTEARAGLVARLKIAEKERDALEADKLAAEAYADKEREACATQRLLAHTFARLARANVEKIQGNLGRLEEKLAHERAKHKEWSTVLEQHEAAHAAGLAEHGAIAAKLESVSSEYKDYERRRLALSESIGHGNGKLKKLGERQSRAATKLAAAEADEAAAGKEVPLLRGAAERAAAQLEREEAALEAALEACSDEADALRARMGEIRGQLAPWEQRGVAARAARAEAEAEIALLRRGGNEAAADLEQAREALDAARAKRDQAQSVISGHAARSNKLQRGVDDAVAAVTAAETHLKGTTAAARLSAQTVSKARESRSASTSASAIAEALASARAAGTIPGVFGRLGDLGSIDAKYDIAVSSAAPALDHYVVDSTDTAQRCVRLLREKRLGVATFLILERQAHLRAAAMAPVPTTPEDVPRLYDVIRCGDDRLRPAFYMALRDTLVAADLDQATRIAYGPDTRWRRVVTVAGEVIAEAGTLSGGGARPRGGRMSLHKSASSRGTVVAAASKGTADNDAAMTAAELEAAQRQAESDEAARREAERALEAAEADLVAARSALAAASTELPRAEMELAAADAQVEDLERRLPGLEAAVQAAKADTKQLAKLEIAVAEAAAELLDVERGSRGPLAKIAQLEATIASIGGEPVRRRRAAIDALQREIELKGAAAATQEAAAAAAVKSASRLRTDLERLRAEAEALESEQEANKRELAELEAAASEVRVAFTACQEELDRRAAALEELSAAYEAKSREVAVIRGVEQDISTQAEQQRSALREESAKVRHWGGKSNAADRAMRDTWGDESAVSCPPDPAELEALDPEDLQYRLTVLQEEMQRMDVRPEAVEAWRNKDAEYSRRAAELETATRARDDERRAHEDLRKQRLDEFMAGFNAISLKLKEMYQMITLGGDAELELVDSLDPFSEGILFSVRPPKKSWKNIANLSGGEKTLSSLSLVFALHHYKPTPLYVMDEIDAALDFRNVSIVGHYIKERTRNAQFVIISLRNNMFELADRLVGIYKTDNATKSVTIDPGAFVVGGAAARLEAEAAQGHAVAAV